MKKCPNCQKEFPDSMRFCQTDGTPLGEPIAEVQPEDPLKTTVVRQEDIASSIPQSDPFKTVVASSGDREESGDLLQLPEELDPMKTMVVAPSIKREEPILEESLPDPPKFEAIKEEIQTETPSSPFSGISQPSEPLTKPDYTNDPTVLQPEPPKFSEPSLSPPSFGDLSAKEEDDEGLAQTLLQNPWDAGNAPKSDQSPFSKPTDAPNSSPFDAPKSTSDALPVNEPQSPFGQPQQTPFESQQSSFEPPKQTFDEPPPTQFGGGQSQFDQMNDPSFGNQPLQQNDWTPPPTPVAGWQDQGLGAQTPFQPPVAMQGQNQTLPIVSLVFGLISLCCYISPVTGIVALITGFLGMKNANNDPNQYGGKGLAIAGMVLGGLFLVVGVLYYALIFLGIAGNLLTR